MKNKTMNVIISVLMAFVLMISPLGASVVQADAASAKTSSSAKVKVAKPAKVSSISATATTNSITLKWGKVKNATGYRVYQSKGGKWVAIKTITNGANTYTVTGLKASTQYSFKVRAYRKSGSSNIWGDASNAFKAKTKAVTRVSISSTSATQNSVTLKWGKIAGATGYRIYQSKDGKWVSIATISGTSYTVKNLKASTTYTFCVKAYKKVSNKVTWYQGSKAVKVKTAAPKSPTELAVAKYNTAVNNAKKLKNGTITERAIIDFKITKTSMPTMKSVMNNILKSLSEDNSTEVWKIKDGKDKDTNLTPNELISPSNQLSKLTIADVTSASEKKTKTGSVITIKLKKETVSYDGKNVSGGSVHKKVTDLYINPVEFEKEMGVSSFKIKSYSCTYTETVLTATLDSKGRLTNLSCKSPMVIGVKVNVLKSPVTMSISGSVNESLSIKY